MTFESHDSSFLEYNWAINDGLFSVTAEPARPLGLRGLTGDITINDIVVSLAEADKISCKKSFDEEGYSKSQVIFTFDGLNVSWVWNFLDKKDRIEIEAELKNDSPQCIAVSDWNILRGQNLHGGIIDLGNSPDQVRFFRWVSWDTRVMRFTAEETTYTSNNFCHLFDPDSGTTLLSSFVTLDRMQGSHRIEYDSALGVKEYCASCKFGKFDLTAGESLKSEKLSLSYHADPKAAITNWAENVNQRYKPSFEGTLDVEWTGYAWADLYTSKERFGDFLFENAKAIREKLEGFEIKYITAGTHYFLKDGLPGNWLDFNDEQAPDGGFKKLFKKLVDMGFVLKLWFSPFWFFAETKGSLDSNRENLLKNIEGSPITEKANWEFDHNRDVDNSLRLTKYYLDGTHPKTKENITNIFKAYRDLGARAYMLDFLSIKDGAKLHDSKLLPIESARYILKVIRQTVTSDTHLQTAVASTPGFIGLINVARIGRDYGEGRAMYPFHGWQNATYVQNDRHFGNAHAFFQNAALNWFTHRKIYLNDFNTLTIDKPVPLEIARISTTMFGLAGGTPLAISDDLRIMDSERLNMLKLCLPRIDNGMPEPVDLFENVYPENYTRMVKLSVQTAWDSYWIIAVVNMDDEAYSVTLDFEKLGLASSGTYRIFEFWNQEYIGTYVASCEAKIPPSACRVYRISKARKHPWLIATDMHMQQGAVDVESLHWDEKRLTLSGVASRPIGEHGSIFFNLPRNFKLINHDHACLMKEVIDMQTVIRLPIEFKNSKEKFELNFEKIPTKYVAWRGWLPYATEEEWLAYVNEHKNPNDTRVIE